MSIVQRLQAVLPRPNNLDEQYEEIDNGMAATIHELNSKDHLQQSADDRIRRAVAVPTDELRRMVENMQHRVATLAQHVEDIIRLSEEATAQASARVRTETDRLNCAIEALSTKG
jgi:hypothetical protein